MAPPAPSDPPLIPETYIDAPSQRLYILSLGCLCQAIKLLDFIRSFAENDTTSLVRKWLAVDFAYCITLSKLRIPRLKYSKAIVLIQIVTLWFLDGLMFGGITLNMTHSKTVNSLHDSARSDVPATPGPFSFRDIISAATFGVLFSSYDGSDAHLIGQHTVRMSPISTARLNPRGDTFCLSPSQPSVLIPVLLNNTDPLGLRYSLTPLGYDSGSRHGKVEHVDVLAKELKAIENSRLERLPVKPAPSSGEIDEYEYDDEDDETDNSHKQASWLQKTQSLTHIRLSKPGTVRLERVLDLSNVDARLAYSEVPVVPCPYVHFVEPVSDEEAIRCSGEDPHVPFRIGIGGVPPLSLKWNKSVNRQRNAFLVEGIEAEDEKSEPSSSRTASSQFPTVTGVPKDLRIPLVVSADAVGTHQYVLEEVTDALGNVVKAGPSLESDPRKIAAKTTRSVRVLQRPKMSFKRCGPGHPASLKIGEETPLTVSANDADSLDAPWEVSLKYQPTAVEDGSPASKHKPWKKVIKTVEERREATLMANTPGDYAIAGIKGKYCEGDILAPDVCTVVEKPHPSAEIEWQKIHECSGDTGVSASLVLHGSPPFTVFYRVQRDRDPPRDLTKQFSTSRGELTIQPQDSGHFTFSFTHLRDQNYRVDLKGPSIDQVIHPLASAEFSQGGRRKISSCEGNVVDVDVDLKGTGPWTLEVQSVSHRGAEKFEFPNIETLRKTLQIPIPKSIDRNGGTFEITLVSIRDHQNCLRMLTVPGITVNVRRIKPTVKFYGKEGKRHVTVLEKEIAEMPLRLTGDGPWSVKYRRAEAPNVVQSARLTTPNDALKVDNKGLYELLEVSDSECPGSVIADASTYSVDWTPRPFAKLSNQTEAIYMRYNGSYILNPICESIPDSVELELTGLPPFQLVYNIARSGENGGTRLLDQPTYSSIQHRTRFELQTSSPGRFFYEVKTIGDAAYPLEKHKATAIPRSERLLFEQEVYSRPYASFAATNRLSYCMNEYFVPQDVYSSSGIVTMQGTAPFTLTLSIKNLAASIKETLTVVVEEQSWKINLPNYQFSAIGPHLITIESVTDASTCAHAALDPLSSSIWVDVAETALIVPFDKRTDICVGDMPQFQLEGNPPWTIGYQINGKSHTQTARSSPFSLLQQQAGDFAIKSIAHQQSRCKAAVTDLQFTVHPLPTAKVGHGKRIYQDIHEGDQAEILFTLEGEPPFTFTYQRAEPQPKKGGKPGKVLETHTVSRIMTHEYSIFSALEGTWTVTSISDKYCRYPSQTETI